MADDPREIRRKLRILEHAEASGDVSKTCRYFGIGRASLYRWRHALRTRGQSGLASKRSVPHNHPNKTPTEVADKVLHLRREYHLGGNGSSGTWSVITASGSPTPASIASSSATA